MSDESEKWRAIGERLRQAREYLELKQEEAADAIGISRSALSLVENGRRTLAAGVTTVRLTGELAGTDFVAKKVFDAGRFDGDLDLGARRRTHDDAVALPVLQLLAGDLDPDAPALQCDKLGTRRHSRARPRRHHDDRQVAAV